MSPKRFFPLALILVGISAAFLYVSSRPASKDYGELALGEDQESEAGEVRSQAALGGQVPEEPNAAVVGPEPRRETIESKTLADRRAAEAITVLPDAVKYTGVVVDPYGAPIAGAKVRVGSPSMEERFRVTMSITSQKAFLYGETDRDGAFVIPFTKPYGLEVAVAVENRGYQRLIGKRTLEGLHEEDLGTFVLELGTVVFGRVIDETGGPIVDAEVFRAGRDLTAEEAGRAAMAAMGIMAREGAVKTDIDGRFEMPFEAPGAITLVVQHEDFLPKTVASTSPETGASMPEWIIPMRTGGVIRGKLVGFPQGRRGVRIAAKQLEGERLAAPGGEESGFGQMIQAVLNPAGDFAEDVQADGSFHFRGLPPDGRFELRAYEPDNFVEQRFLSRMTEAQVGDMSVVLAYDAGATVSFVVIDAVTKAPVESFQVKASWPEDNQRLFFGPGDDKRKERYPKGKVTLYEVRPPGDQNDLTLRIQAPGYFDGWRTGIAVSKGSLVQLGSIALDPAPTRSFVVLDAKTKEPIRRATVSLVGHTKGLLLAMEDEEEAAITVEATDDETEDGTAQTQKRSTNRTDREGRCELSLFRAEEATLKVNARGYAPFQENPFALAPNPLEHIVYLSRGATIEFSVVDEVGIAVPNSVLRAKDGRPFASMRTDATGRKSRTRVPSGDYAFRAVRTDQKNGVRWWENDDTGTETWTQLSVESGETYQLALVVPSVGQLRGQVVTNSGPLAGAMVSVSWISADDPGEELAELVQSFGGQGGGSETNGEGRFLVRGVSQGYYRVWVRHPDFAMAHQEVLHITSDDQNVLLTMPQTGVSGRVTDADGKPIVGAQIYGERVPKDGGENSRNRGFFRAARMFQGQTPHVTTNNDGEYVLRGLTPGLPLRVRAEADGFVLGLSDSFQLSPNQLRTATNLRLIQGGRIDITATSEQPLTGLLLVEAKFVGERDPKPGEEMAILKGGVGSITGLCEGLWEVSLTRQAMNRGGTKTTVEPKQVQVEAGGTATVLFELD